MADFIEYQVVFQINWWISELTGGLISELLGGFYRVTGGFLDYLLDIYVNVSSRRISRDTNGLATCIKMCSVHKNCKNSAQNLLKIAN